MRDPRDKNFYRVQKKARTSLKILSPDELRKYLSCTDKMFAYVPDKKARKQCSRFASVTIQSNMVCA